MCRKTCVYKPICVGRIETDGRTGISVQLESVNICIKNTGYSEADMKTRHNLKAAANKTLQMS